MPGRLPAPSTIHRGVEGTAQNPTADTRTLILIAFEESYGDIARYVAAKTGDRDLAEDVASEVFVRALQYAARFTLGDRRIDAWLFTIARNIVIDHYRRRATKPPLLSLEQCAEVGADDDKLDEVCFRMDVNEGLRHGMGCLTKSESEVLTMRIGGGLSTTAVAESLGKTPNAVRWLQHSAVTKLRARLA